MTEFTGNGRDDYLTAYAEGDLLAGLGGNDFLSDNGFRIQAEGGGGDDLYALQNAASSVAETLLGGVDTIWLYAAGSFVLPDHVEHVEFFSGDVADATGNALNNRIVGNAGVNILVGLAGDDVIRGAGGGDRLDGGDGGDFLDPGGGAAVLVTGTGADILYVNKEAVEAHYTVQDFDLALDRIQVRGFWDYEVAQSGADALVTFSPYVTLLMKDVDAGALGDAQFEFAPRPDDHTFVGTDHGESLYGWAPGDSCYGLDGADHLGDHDSDWSILHGGKGDDTYEVNNPLDQVVEAEDQGRDLVWLYITGDYMLPDHVEDVNVTGAASVTGNAGDNAFQGSGADDLLFGMGGDDVIRANFGADRIDGGDGDDFLDGGGGDSILAGGAGADSIFVDWESGNHLVEDFDVAEDRLEVWTFASFQTLDQVGEDTMIVFWSGYGGDPNATTSVLLENVRADTLGSANFNFIQTGGAAPDRIVGGLYSDDLHGGGGGDRIGGAGGADDLAGGAGGDIIRGGLGADLLRGGAGDDVLIGNAGRDVLNGGAGADRYLFRSAIDAKAAAPDRIYGFDAASGDVIDLSAIDADEGAEGDQAFTFVASFTGAAGQALLTYDAVRDRTTLSLDLDGDAAADFGLLVMGQLSADTGWAL